MIVLMEILYLGFTGFLNHQQYRLGCSTSLRIPVTSYDYDDIFRRPGITNLPLLHPRWWGTHQKYGRTSKIKQHQQPKKKKTIFVSDIYIYFRKKTSSMSISTIYGQFITTSAEVTPNGGLVRESFPKWP